MEGDTRGEYHEKISRWLAEDTRRPIDEDIKKILLERAKHWLERANDIGRFETAVAFLRLAQVPRSEMKILLKPVLLRLVKDALVEDLQKMKEFF
jgi:hypothetical protein